MPEDHFNYQTSDPDVFCRGSLKLTYELLRKEHATLALNVRNIIGNAPLPKKSSQPDNKNSDHFRVNLDSFQIRAVVEALLEYSQLTIHENDNYGMVVMAKALTRDWLELAHKMVAELPDSEDP